MPKAFCAAKEAAGLVTTAGGAEYGAQGILARIQYCAAVQRALLPWMWRPLSSTSNTQQMLMKQGLSTHCCTATKTASSMSTSGPSLLCRHDPLSHF